MKPDSKVKTSKSNEELKLDSKEVKSNILPLFWDLASLEEEKRTGCVIDLVYALKGTEVDFKKGKIHSENIENDKAYALQRLVKGLSSSRKGARQGYATALVQLLTQFHDIDMDKVFDLMNEHLSTKGSFKSQEERDAYFGQVFCHAAVGQASLQRNIEQEQNVPWIAKTVEGLLILMTKKSFLQELCAKLIVDILQKVDAGSFSKDILPLLDNILKKGWNNCTPEDLQILLAVERLFKDSLGKAFFKSNWGHSTVCDKENFEKISQVLMESTVTAHPRVHTVWKEVIQNIMKSTKSLKSFWETVVEEGLMQSSHERKFLAFKALQDILSDVNKSQAEIVFSSRLMKSIFNGCTSEKNYLYTAIKNFLSSIPSQVAKNSKEGVALAVIYQLIGRHGNFQFDMITKTKTIESLIGLLDSTSVKEFVSWLKDLYVSGKDNESEQSSEKSDDDSTSPRRKWAITQLLVITRNSETKKDEGLMQDIAKFLFFHAYFHVTKKRKSQAELYTIPDPPVEETVLNVCRERFVGVLGEISNILPSQEGETGEKLGKTIVGTTKNGDFYAYHILKVAKGLLDDSKHVTLNKGWSSEATEAFNTAFKVIEDIRSAVPRDAGMSESRAFELIFLHTCLQMFDNTEEAVDIIQELQECYKKVHQKKHKENSEEEPHWSEVLTEILLSFLAQSSNLMRHVVNLVFSMILPNVTSTAFNLILEALGPKKNSAAGGLELVQESDEEMESNEDESDSDQSEDGPDSDEDAGEESDEGSVDDSDDGDEIDEAFRSEVKSALGEGAVIESDDDSEENEASDVDMDTVDPKLLNFMDKALAAAFKARVQAKSGKKKKEVKKKTVLHFRLRVLDVVETFVKKQPKSPLMLDLIEPLLEIIKASAGHKDEKALHDRVQGLLKNKICHARELPSGSDVSQENVHEQIGRLVKVACHAPSVEIVNLVTQASMMLIRVLRGKEDIREPSPLKTRSQRKRKNDVDVNPDEPVNSSNDGVLDAEKIVSIFKEALADFMLKRNSHLHPVLFLELIKRYPAVAWKMAPEIPAYFSKAVNNFRKVQACEMLIQLLAKKTGDSKKEFQQLVVPLQNEFILVFQSACEESCSMKARHFHEFVKLLDRFIKEGNKNSEIFSHFKSNQVAKAMSSAVDGPIISRSPQLVAYCKKLVSSLNGPIQNGEVAKKKQKGGGPTITEDKSEDLSGLENKSDNIEKQTEGRAKRKKKSKLKNKDM